jgi:polyisoprenyl-teichoic acid--peptidoglycan teichoic acid transferase
MRLLRMSGVLLGGLLAWVVGAALLVDPPRAGAQDPPIEFGHQMKAKYLPQPGKDPFYVLAIGSDYRPGQGESVERSLADSLHLIGVNPKEGAASILGFPRDAYVPIPGYGSQRINNALFNGGPELVVETVEELVGVDIDYYLLTAFDGFRAMVTGVGGIEVEVPYPMSDSASGASFDAGPATLDGPQALAFARNRKDTPNGDFSRSENQGRLILAALDQLQRDVRKDPIRLFTWIVVGAQNLQTDLSLNEIFDLMLTGLSIDPEQVANRVVPGGLGFAGSASVVMLSSEADALFADIADDGLLEPAPSDTE